MLLRQPNSTLLHCLPTDAGGEEDFGRWRFRRDDLDHWEPFFFLVCLDEKNGKRHEDGGWQTGSIYL